GCARRTLRARGQPDARRVRGERTRRPRGPGGSAKRRAPRPPSRPAPVWIRVSAAAFPDCVGSWLHLLYLNYAPGLERFLQTSVSCGSEKVSGRGCHDDTTFILSPHPCHPEVADAPEPLWRRRERSDEESAPAGTSRSRSFA